MINETQSKTAGSLISTVIKPDISHLLGSIVG